MIETIEPGTARLADITLDYRALTRASRTARLAVRSSLSGLRPPFSFAERTYAGRYTSEAEQQPTPNHLLPLVQQLDQLFPEDLTEISILRERYRGKKDVEPVHPDSVKDYRTITILSGEGNFWMHSGSSEVGGSGIMRGSQAMPFKTGSVILLNNLIDQTNQRLWHRTQGGALMLVYGKYERRALTWQS